MRAIAIKLVATLLAFVLIGAYAVTTHKKEIAREAAKAEAEKAGLTETSKTAAPVKATPKGAVELPEEQDFQDVAETELLTLKADPKTGNFIAVDKRNGNVWRSYPDPDQWKNETVTGKWRNNLRSPIMYETVDLTNRNLLPSELSNMFDDGGEIANWQKIDGGFKFQVSIPSKQLVVPVEVRIKDDYVETKIADSELKEGKYSLINMKLYPFFGAEQSVGQDGYMFVPDGSGALIRLKTDRISEKGVFERNVYGPDLPFQRNTQSDLRNSVRMPVFGLKSGEMGFIAVIDAGAEYDNIYASPSGSYSQYNWVTANLNFRMKYHQSTSKSDREKGFDTFNSDRFHSDRTVRYFLLNKGKADYSGMASRYRDYLMQEQGLTRIKPKSGSIPLFVNILGGDTEKGFITDHYVPGTTTSEALQMVKSLYGLGMENMTVTYSGWQQGGASSLGNRFPVDKRLGGNAGMSDFILFARSLHIPVYLQANYTMNNNGKSGFSSNRDGIRDLGQTVLKLHMLSGKTISYVSPQFMQQQVERELTKYKEIGAAGIYYDSGIGNQLFSDFNTNYPASRLEVRQIQQSILAKTAEAVGGVQVSGGNFYALNRVDHIHGLPEDYSYDLLIDEPIPFAQIALHGLITYSADYANQRERYKSDLLRSIEYGSYPSFVLSNADAHQLAQTYTYSTLFNSGYSDWEAEAVEEYQQFNKALGDVQDQFIVKHSTIAPNVKETDYSNGKRVIVNYNANAYTDGTLQVPAQNFIVLNGGATP